MQDSVVEGRALAIREEVHAPVIGDAKPLRYSLPELRSVGEIMFQSGMFKDLRSVQQAMVKLLAGAELGYGPFQSLRAFHVIEGRPVETSGEVTARIKRSGKYRMESYFIDAAGNHLDPIKTKAVETNGCVVQIFERLDGAWHELEPTVFAKEDAATAGLLSKQVWKSYLRDMLFARALTAAARRHCADIFGGPIYGPEEFGAEVSIDGNGEQVIVSDAKALAPPAAFVEQQRDNASDQRANAAKQCVIYASQKQIPDDWRHEIAQAFFGETSTKKLGLDDLRKLYALLVDVKNKRGEDTWTREDFAEWLQFTIAEAARLREEKAAE